MEKKADSLYKTVSAASIIAKVSRLDHELAAASAVPSYPGTH